MKKSLIKILTVVLILELTIFNFGSYRILSKKDKISISSNDIEYIETDEENVTIVEVKNINKPVKTVFIDLDNIYMVAYQFLYTDETNSAGFNDTPKKEYFEDLNRSKYISTYLSGNSNKIQIKFFEANVRVEEIVINGNIPLQISFPRILILYLIFTFIYACKKSELFNQKYSKDNLKQEAVLLGILAVFLILVSYLNDFCREENVLDFYSRDFVNALCKGQVYLDITPSEGIQNLSNPYDSSQRIEAGLVRGEDYLWDVALYKNHYYVYFGILPALILLVPYHLITNEYLSCAFGVLIFSILAAISMKALIENIFKKYFKEVEFKFVALSLLIILFGSQILILNGIPRFYELPIIAGLFFAITGINFAIEMNTEEKTSYKKMFLSAMFLSLSVACRPTMLLVSFVIVPILLKIFIANVKNKKNVLKNILVVAIPYLTVRNCPYGI